MNNTLLNLENERVIILHQKSSLQWKEVWGDSVNKTSFCSGGKYGEIRFIKPPCSGGKYGGIQFIKPTSVVEEIMGRFGSLVFPT